MSLQEFVDILHELLKLDTEEGMVKSTFEMCGFLMVETFDDSIFFLSVRKIDQY